MSSELDKMLKKRGMKWLLEGLLEVLEKQPQEGYIVTLRRNLQVTLDDYNSRYEDDDE